MLERTFQVGKYDPRIYGELKAAFLEKLDETIPSKSVGNESIDQEILRQQLIKDIKEGKFAIES